MTVWCTDKIGWSQTLRMAYKYAAGGNYEKAIEYYKDALKEGKNSVLIYNNLADTYMNTDRLDEAMVCAEEAMAKAKDKAIFYVTLGEIYQAKGEHKRAVDYIIRAQKIFEESVPELKNIVFDSVDEVIKKLSSRVKFDIASNDWIRIVYLVKSMISSYQAERDYVKRGVSWKFLFDIRKNSLSSIGQKYLWTKEKLGIKGNDAIAIANTYGAMCAITGSSKVIVVGKSRISSTIRISACWQYSVIKSMELDKDPGWIKCSCMCAKQLNSMAKAINPDIYFEFTPTLVDGLKYCKGIFKIKESEH